VLEELKSFKNKTTAGSEVLVIETRKRAHQNLLVLFLGLINIYLMYGRMQIGLKFQEETSEMLHLEHGVVWCRNLDASGSRSETPGKF
jgi:hypothetical protein